MEKGLIKQEDSRIVRHRSFEVMRVSDGAVVISRNTK